MANRLNTSLLARGERRVLQALAPRLPAWTTPDHLTAAGLVGAAMTAAGFALTHWSAGFLTLVVAGLFLNWFGDSLDGTLARYRGIERPRYGFLLDHSSDLIAQSLIVVGLGVSPYFTLPSALFVLSLYLLMSSYTYLRVATAGVHRLSYGGMGATEFRILVAAWSLFACWLGPQVVEARLWRFSVLDVTIGTMSAIAFALFVLMVRQDLSRMDRDDDHESATIHRLPTRRSAAEPAAAEPARELPSISAG
ncbi:phosphatidylglycerophosphate synthase [Methylosinus sp. sav-2]|uniref:CDP-alcohol phosphatidyltransferase family protein n=1 Tax=unclassified Methylosinus TaxID=2624500 RepID=UPI0004B3C650|nr:MULTISPECIES: CDP-alcohol phosphatidyltransferase family protein [unclassified Methylosinus]TDX64340.1 phosphatidylglycerophosphate synthase [Methylosinus sp. sav-2]